MEKYLKDVNTSDIKREMSRMTQEGIIDPSVRALTETVVWDRQDQVAAVFDFVKDSFPYTEDPEYERFISPKRMSEDYSRGVHYGEDCDSLSMLTAAMLGSIGYPTKVMLADTDFDLQYDHCLAQVWSDRLGRWVNVDTSAELPLGWEIQMLRKTYI